MAEMWTRSPIMQGNTEQHQLTLISQLCGSITAEVRLIHDAKTMEGALLGIIPVVFVLTNYYFFSIRCGLAWIKSTSFIRKWSCPKARKEK